MKCFDVYPINDINIVKAQGSTLWDDAGNEYLDMYGGHAVISIGHTAERYVKYLEHQLEDIGFYSNSIRIPQQAELAEKLGILSGKEEYSLFLCNSGAEANENAIKLASFYNSRKRVIAFSTSFHGRTSLAVAATDNPKIVAPVNETENITFVEYNNVEALREEFAKGGVSSVIVEAIQGVGGVKMATAEFLSAIRELCDEHDAVMIADCVQCGCGRSGAYFALDHSGIKADIYSMAKGIGNGFPVGGIMIAPQFKPSYGLLGTTFGGNHLACAAALAVVDDINDKNLVENAATMGKYLMEQLSSIDDNRIVELRGRGLMIGVVMDSDSKAIRSKMLHTHKIFVGSASDNRIIRILPSLTIGREECDRLIVALKSCLQDE
ncbi:MAG: aminotransferase class III-fold pyridoxal phosphate-dependent enzyme [Rikenellaceae bacterium]